MIRTKYLLPIVFSLVLAGCGEGGGSISGNTNGGGGSNSGNTSGDTSTTVSKFQWYMRVTTEAVANDGHKYAHTSGGVFGELSASKNGKDRHDIPTFGPAVFHVVFPHYFWKDASGDYDSDYRQSGTDTEEHRVWTFQVKNQKGADLSDADFTLHIQNPVKVRTVYDSEGGSHYAESKGDPSMKKDFTLIDVDDHQSYSLDQLDQITFNMEGKHVRTFRIVRGEVQDGDYQAPESSH